MDENSPICDSCGERLGTYEPLVLELSDGTRLRGGYLVLRERTRGIDARLRHARCVDPEQSHTASAVSP